MSPASDPPARPGPPIALPARQARAALPSVPAALLPPAHRRATRPRDRMPRRRATPLLWSRHRPLAATGRTRRRDRRRPTRGQAAGTPAGRRITAANANTTQAIARLDTPNTPIPRGPGPRRAASATAAIRSPDSPSQRFPRTGFSAACATAADRAGCRAGRPSSVARHTVARPSGWPLDAVPLDTAAMDTAAGRPRVRRCGIRLAGYDSMARDGYVCESPGFGPGRGGPRRPEAVTPSLHPGEWASRPGSIGSRPGYQPARELRRAAAGRLRRAAGGLRGATAWKLRRATGRLSGMASQRLRPPGAANWRVCGPDGRLSSAIPVREQLSRPAAGWLLPFPAAFGAQRADPCAPWHAAGGRLRGAAGAPAVIPGTRSRARRTAPRRRLPGRSAAHGRVPRGTAGGRVRRAAAGGPGSGVGEAGGFPQARRPGSFGGAGQQSTFPGSQPGGRSRSHAVRRAG